MKRGTFKRQIAENIREIVFGLEDSLVSTLGAVTGIAVGSKSVYIVILSGLVLITAESVSMAAGSYLSSKSAIETERQIHAQGGKTFDHDWNPLRGGIVMGVFYIVGGFVPLLPYFFLNMQAALIVSVGLTAVSLFFVGLWASNYTKRSAIKSGLEMVSVSLTAALIGYLVGVAVSSYFGMGLQ